MTRAVFLTLAAVAPLAALWLAAPADRVTLGLAVRPFAWPSLLVAHVFGAVPAAWLLARLISKRFPSDNPGPAVVLGALLAWAGYRWGDALGGALDDEQVGFLARAFARSLFCVLLALPWSVAAVASSRPASPLDPFGAFATALVAFALPAVYADRCAGQAITEASVLGQRDRVGRIAPPLAAAADIAPGWVPERRVLPDTTPTMTVAQLKAVLAKGLKLLTARADLPPAKPMLEHGQLLLALDRLAEAEEYLRPLAARNPAARVSLGECLHLRGRWADGDAELRSALGEMLPHADKPGESEKCANAYDLLAESATARRNPADREAVLRDGLEKLPRFAGYFHMQLGRHFQASGRPFDALAELDAAEKADPKMTPQIEPLRRDLREHTPGCLVR